MDILVFDTESVVDHISLKDETQLFYESLKKKNILPSVHINAFQILESREENEKLTHSTINSILITQLLPYTIPIISTFPISMIPPVQNPLAPIKKKKAVAPIKENSILVKLKKDTICILQKSHELVLIPKENDIEVTGIFIPVTSHKKIPLPCQQHLHDTFQSGSFSLYNECLEDYSDFYTNIRPIIVDSTVTTNGSSFQLDEKSNEKLTNVQHAVETIIFLKKRSVSVMHEFVSAWNSKITRNIINPTLFKPKFISEKSPLSKAIKISLSYEFPFDVKNAALNSGYFNEYVKLETYTGKEANTLLEELKYNSTVEDAKKTQIFKRFAKQMEIYQKKNIALKRFGTIDIYKLTEKENEILEKEYQKIKSASLSEDERELLNELSETLDKFGDTKSILKKFSDFLDPKQKYDLANLTDKQKTALLINKEGKGLLCPHLIEKANLLTSDKYDNIVQKVSATRDYLINQYAMEETDDNARMGYFCKICGERIAPQPDDSNVTISTQQGYSNDSDQDILHTIIYREVIYIVSTYVAFTDVTAINLGVMVKNITNSIKGEIRNIESHLLKVKTAKAEDISLTIGVYIYLYAFAALCQLIYTNSSTMHFRDIFARGGAVRNKSPFLTSEPEKDVTEPEKDNTNRIKSKVIDNATNRNSLQKILTTGLNIVKKIKYLEIQKSPFLNVDTIRDVFIKTYRWVISLNYVNISGTHNNYFMQDDILNYLVYAYNQSNPKSHLPKFDTSEFARYLYKPDNSVLSKLRDGLPNILQLTYEEIAKLHGTSMYSKAISITEWSKNKYIYGSYQAFYDFLKNELYKEKSHDSQALIAHREKYAYLLEEDKKIKRNRLKHNLRPVISLKSITYDAPEENTCFCAKPKLIFQKGSEKKEFTSKEIANWYNAGDIEAVKEFLKWKLVNKDCGNDCNQTKGKIHIFYKFYENICPVSELHHFDNGACKKCGLTPTMMENLDKSYFSKYETKYDQTRDKERKLMTEQLERASYHKPPTKPSNLPKYEPQFHKVNDLIKLLKLNENEFRNIGFYEKRDKQDVIRGNLNMTDFTRDQIEKRNNQLMDYYLYLIRNYSILRHSELISNYPDILKDFLKKHNNKDLYKDLKPLGKGIMEEYREYRRLLEPKELSNYLLELISDTALQIHKGFINIKKEAMGLEFITLLINNIIKSEKKRTNFIVLKTKPNKSIENEEKIEGEDIVRDDFDAADDTGELDEIAKEADFVDEDLEEVNENEDVEENEDAFSIGELDVEAEEDDDADNLYHDIEDKISYED